MASTIRPRDQRLAALDKSLLTCRWNEADLVKGLQKKYGCRRSMAAEEVWLQKKYGCRRSTWYGCSVDLQAQITPEANPNGASPKEEVEHGSTSKSRGVRRLISNLNQSLGSLAPVCQKPGQISQLAVAL
jgi:hypothetical protein